MELWVTQFGEVVARGGGVMWAIFTLAAWMWILILERYHYYFVRFPRLQRKFEEIWQARPDRESATARQLRRLMLGRLRSGLERRLKLISALTSLLPMLGLLGTVVGMIETFRVMTVFGMGNPRGMAGAVSICLTTTWAGLFCALPGYFLVVEMRRGASAELEEAGKRLE